MLADRRRFLQTGAAAAALAGVSSPARAAKLKPAYAIADGPLTSEEFTQLKAMTEEVFAGNRVVTEEGTFHMPSKGKYSSLFGWDSGWHGLAMTSLDPAIAASEIEMVMNRQLPDGRVSHNVRFQHLEEDQTGPWYGRITHEWNESQYDENGVSYMIDPPSYILAAERIYKVGGDRVWLDRMLPRLEACLHYLTTERDLFGDGLVSVIHPWETGTDSSPAYDRILHLDFNTPLGAPARGLKYNRMVKWCSEFKWDPQEAKRRNRFILEDLCYNSITVRAILAVANLNEMIGEAGKAAKWRDQAAAMVDAMDRIHWDDKMGCYYSRYDVKRPKFARRNTCASILPLLTGLVPPERAERVLRSHILNPDRYWLDFLFPFSSDDEMRREKVFLEDMVLWRGHCIWVNMSYLVLECLRNYGMKEEARELVRRTARMVAHEGLWEFYDYRNGQGKGQPHFNWPGLVLPMIEDSWPEITA